MSEEERREFEVMIPDPAELLERLERAEYPAAEIPSLKMKLEAIEDALRKAGLMR